MAKLVFMSLQVEIHEARCAVANLLQNSNQSCFGGIYEDGEGSPNSSIPSKLTPVQQLTTRFCSVHFYLHRNVWCPTWCGHSCVGMPNVLGNWCDSRGLVGSFQVVWGLRAVRGVKSRECLGLVLSGPCRQAAIYYYSTISRYYSSSTPQVDCCTATCSLLCRLAKYFSERGKLHHDHQTRGGMNEK
jgi:hypothetical protein